MKVVILGDGLLGNELKSQTNWDHISRKSNGIDFSKEIEKYFELILKNCYDVVVNCIANTNTYGGTLQEHYSLNCDRVQDLVEFCNNNKIKLVHISTDYLYTNSKSYSKESDIVKPIATLYGLTKNLGDYHVQLNSKDYLIVRTSFKPTPFPYDRAVQQVGNFDYVDVISKSIVELILKNASGVFNVGTGKKTMLELARMTRSDVLEYEDSSNVNSMMPKDVSMNVEKMKEFLR